MKKILQIVSSLLSLLGVLLILSLYVKYKISPITIIVLTTISAICILLSKYNLEVASGLMFAVSCSWLLENFELLGYAIFFNCWSKMPYIQIVVISLVSTMLLFVSAFQWNKMDGKRPNVKKLIVLLLMLAVVPFCSFIYKTHEEKDIRFQFYATTDKQWGFRMSNNNGDRYSLKLFDKNTIRAIISNSDKGRCNNCSIRVRTSFSEIREVTLLYNYESELYFDDIASIKIPKTCKSPIFDFNINDLRW